jgi:hypothetical protein
MTTAKKDEPAKKADDSASTDVSKTTRVLRTNVQGVDGGLPDDEMPTGKEKGDKLAEVQSRIAEGAGTMPPPERPREVEDKATSDKR